MFQRQQQQTPHHERQVNESIVADNEAIDGNVDKVVMRHQSNGRLSQSNRLSDHRRSRLKGASATLDSEDLYNAGIMELWTNGEQRGLPASSDGQILPRNGKGSMHVEKETTC